MIQVFYSQFTDEETEAWNQSNITQKAAELNQGALALAPMLYPQFRMCVLITDNSQTLSFLSLLHHLHWLAQTEVLSLLLLEEMSSSGS